MAENKKSNSSSSSNNQQINDHLIDTLGDLKSMTTEERTLLTLILERLKEGFDDFNDVKKLLQTEFHKRGAGKLYTTNKILTQDLGIKDKNTLNLLKTSFSRLEGTNLNLKEIKEYYLYVIRISEILKKSSQLSGFLSKIPQHFDKISINKSVEKLDDYVKNVHKLEDTLLRRQGYNPESLGAKVGQGWVAYDYKKNTEVAVDKKLPMPHMKDYPTNTPGAIMLSRMNPTDISPDVIDLDPYQSRTSVSISKYADNVEERNKDEKYQDRFIRKILKGIGQLPFFKKAEKVVSQYLNIKMLEWASDKPKPIQKAALVASYMQLPESTLQLGGDILGIVLGELAFHSMKRAMRKFKLGGLFAFLGGKGKKELEEGAEQIAKKGLWGKLGGFFKGLWGFIANLGKFIGRGFKGVWTFVANPNIWKGLGNFFKGTFNLIKNLGGNTLSKIFGFIKNPLTLAKLGLKGVKGLAGPLGWAALGTDIASQFGDTAIKNMDWTAGQKKLALTGMHIVSGAVQGAAIGSVFGPHGMAIGAAVLGIYGLIKGLTEDVGDMKDKSDEDKEWYEKLAEWARGSAGQISDFVSGAWNGAGKWIKGNIVAGKPGAVTTPINPTSYSQQSLNKILGNSPYYEKLSATSSYGMDLNSFINDSPYVRKGMVDPLITALAGFQGNGYDLKLTSGTSSATSPHKGWAHKTGYAVDVVSKSGKDLEAIVQAAKASGLFDAWTEDVGSGNYHAHIQANEALIKAIEANTKAQIEAQRKKDEYAKMGMSPANITYPKDDSKMGEATEDLICKTKDHK